MRICPVRRHVATAALFLAALCVGPPVFAQMSVRVNIPGTAFSPDRGSDPVAIEDVAGGRRFRGGAFSLVKLRGAIQVPPAATADPTMRRLVLHFRTSPSGPSLRSVALFNGSTAVIRVETQLKGDFTAKETTTPVAIANAWEYRDPVRVSAQSILRLEVQFPGGFDSPVDPGEFILTSVSVDFPRRLPDRLSKADLETSGRYRSREPSAPSTTPSRPPAATANGVIYARAANDELLWYDHTGRDEGGPEWAAPQGKQVGRGWNFQQVFSGGDGVIYAITSSGDLLWYRHEGRADGSFRWTAPEGRKVGTGWNFEHVFSGGGGVIYAITSSGDLLWYRHDGHADGSARWAAPAGKKVGTGWNFKDVFSGERPGS